MTSNAPPQHSDGASSPDMRCARFLAGLCPAGTSNTYSFLMRSYSIPLGMARRLPVLADTRGRVLRIKNMHHQIGGGDACREGASLMHGVQARLRVRQDEACCRLRRRYEAIARRRDGCISARSRPHAAWQQQQIQQRRRVHGARLGCVSHRFKYRGPDADAGSLGAPKPVCTQCQHAQARVATACCEHSESLIADAPA